MEGIDKHMIIEAVKKAKSSKQALDGVKLLFEDASEYKEIFHACFEEAWRDATRRNRIIERSHGKKRDIAWKPRYVPTEQEMKKDLHEFLHFKNKARVLGRVLSSYNELAIKQIFEMIRNSHSVSN